MALNIFEILLRIVAPDATKATDAAAKGLEKVGDAAKKTTEEASKARGEFVQVAGAFTSLVIAKQVIGVFTDFAGAAATVQTGLADLRTVMNLTSTDELMLKNRMMEVSEATGNSFKDTALAVKNLLAQGLSPTAAAAMIEPLSKLSKVGDLSVESATNLGVALTNMGVHAEQSKDAFDMILKLSNISSLAPKDFVDVLTKAGPAATNAGVSFRDLAISAAMLRKGFASGAEEGTTLAGMLTALTNSKKAGKLDKAFGVDVFDAAGNLKSLPPLFLEISKSIGTTGREYGKLSEIFGARTGGRGLATAISDLQKGMDVGGGLKTGVDLLNEFGTAAQMSGNTLENSFNEKMNTAVERFNQLKVVVFDMAANLGGPLLGAIQAVLNPIATVVKFVGDFIRENQTLATVLGTVAAGMATFALGVGLLIGFAGVARLAGFAVTFLASEVFNARLALGGMLARGLAASTGIAAVGGAAAAATTGVKALTFATKGMWSSLLGPLGIIFMLFDIFPMIAHLLGFGGAKVERNAEISNDLAKTAKSLDTAAGKLSDASAVYGKLVDEFTKGILKKYAVYDPRNEGVTSDVLTKLSQVKGYGAMSTTQSKPFQDAIHQFFKENEQPGGASAKTFDAAVASFQWIANKARMLEAMHVPGMDKSAERLTKAVENMAIATSPTMVTDRKITEAAMTAPLGASAEAIVKSALGDKAAFGALANASLPNATFANAVFVHTEVPKAPPGGQLYHDVADLFPQSPIQAGHGLRETMFGQKRSTFIDPYDTSATAPIGWHPAGINDTRRQSHPNTATFRADITNHVILDGEQIRGNVHQNTLRHWTESGDGPH